MRRSGGRGPGVPSPLRAGGLYGGGITVVGPGGGTNDGGVTVTGTSVGPPGVSATGTPTYSRNALSRPQNLAPSSFNSPHWPHLITSWFR